MSEGELKKRIKDYAYEMGEVHDVAINCGEWNCANKACVILDEAKKDFPMPKKMIHGLTEDSNESGSLGVVSILEIAVWFKKWFGDKT